MLRRTLPLLAIAGLGFIAFASTDSALADEPSPSRLTRRPPPWRPPPVQAQFQAELIDDGMNNLPMFFHNGKKYVMGSLGQRYRIRVTNPTANRVEAVVSVDGLDAIDGQTATLSKRGYVVPAFGSVTIDGFRTSMNSVAAFRFTSVPDSYAGRTGQDRNVGVIGVAIFRERVEQPIEIVPRPRPRSAAPSAAPRAGEGRSSAAKKPTDRPGLGTQFGEQHESRVRQTAFIRDSASPTQTVELRYNDRAGLRALGIQIPPEPAIVDDDLRLRESATPFPGDRRFAQPPP
ncbi:MAG: hypothetical protein IPM54_07305 [Polyangiaceae bacterium]|nr:hypothetical protein [Polyangiaceae bacterium]